MTLRTVRLYYKRTQRLELRSNTLKGQNETIVELHGCHGLKYLS